METDRGTHCSTSFGGIGEVSGEWKGQLGVVESPGREYGLLLEALGRTTP